MPVSPIGTGELDKKKPQKKIRFFHLWKKGGMREAGKAIIWPLNQSQQKVVLWNSSPNRPMVIFYLTFWGRIISSSRFCGGDHGGCCSRHPPMIYPVLFQPLWIPCFWRLANDASARAHYDSPDMRERSHTSYENMNDPSLLDAHNTAKAGS